MSKQICDVCGSEFVWQKGMVYCSYDCERKARLKREQQAEAYLKKIEKEMAESVFFGEIDKCLQ